MNHPVRACLALAAAAVLVTACGDATGPSTYRVTVFVESFPRAAGGCWLTWGAAASDSTVAAEYRVGRDSAGTWEQMGSLRDHAGRTWTLTAVTPGDALTVRWQVTAGAYVNADTVTVPACAGHWP